MINLQQYIDANFGDGDLDTSRWKRETFWTEEFFRDRYRWRFRKDAPFLLQEREAVRRMDTIISIKGPDYLFVTYISRKTFGDSGRQRTRLFGNVERGIDDMALVVLKYGVR